MKNRAFDYDTSRFPRWIDPNDVTPFEGNAKTHTKKQIQNIARSIRRAGWQQDTVLTRDNVLVIGHGRRLAALEIGCMMPFHTVDKDADELTQEEIDVLREVDNLTSAETGFDAGKMSVSFDRLNTLGFSFKPADFKMAPIEFGDDAREERENREKREESEEREAQDDDFDPVSRLTHNTFENFEREFTPVYTGKYDIPQMDATHTTGTEFLRFCDWRELDDPGEHIAHFYYDDFKFIQAWRDPDCYIDRLKRFRAVIAPDFSLYTDFPRALQILSCYRRQWVGAYWQSLGIDVIPDVVWGEESSFEFCFDGIPEHSVVAVSSVGVKRDGEWNGTRASLFKAGYDEMMRRLKPETVLYYGDMIDGLTGNIIRIPSFYEQRRGMLNEMKAKKRG